MTIDRCERCSGCWFDAAELDRILAEHYPADTSLPEARIPSRGITSRRCPRCNVALESAGWDDLVIERCRCCRGLFLDAHELVRLQREQPPLEHATFEQQLRAAMYDAGWALLLAKSLAPVLIRFLR